MATESKMEAAPKWAWTVWTVLTIAILSVLSVGVIKVIPSGARKPQYQRTQTSAATQQVQPTTRTVHVDSTWKRESIPPKYWCRFDFDQGDTLQVRFPNYRNRILEKANGRWFEGGQPLEKWPDDPSPTFDLKSKNGKVMMVTVSTWA